MKNNKLVLPQLFVKTNHSIFESTISMDQLIEFSLKNKHKHVFFTESQWIKHFPTFHLKAKNKGLIPLLSLHYIWENSSEWLLIPKNYEGYEALSRFTNKNELLEDNEWSQIIKIFISGDEKSIPWKDDQDFYIANSDCPQGISVRENLFLKEEDYDLFALVSSLKNKSSFSRELELNSHLKNSYLLNNYSENNNVQRIKNLIKLLKECNFYSLREKSQLSLFKKNKRGEILEHCSSRLEKYILEFPKEKQLEYQKRYKREINLFDLKGYWDYFSIVWELTQYIQKSNILISPGRGSSCGSLLIFLMGVNQIDPFKYGLLLDRFLNETSERMPDLDIDIEGSRRLEILKFLQSTFGEESFIIPSILKRIKNINSIFAALQKVFSEEEKDSQLIGKLIDLPFLIQPHPSSIIPIFSTFLESTYKDDNSVFPVTPLEYSSTSYIHLQKFDLLSSQYLEFISEIIKDIGFSSQQLFEINFEDKNTWNLLNRGLTYYLFHLDSSYIKSIIPMFELKSISDLAQLLAIIRPGINKHISKFLNYKSPKDSNCPPLIRELLLETRGIILFQEQIMNIVSKVTGMSLSSSDKYRIILQKNKIEELSSLKREFFSLAREKKRNNFEINQIWNFINTFGKYSFNKSHAVAYAALSFQAAYLKANYCEKFFISAIKREGLSESCLEEIKSMGYKIKVINFLNKVSHTGFFDSEKKEFYIGLNGIKYGSSQLFQLVKKIESEIKNNSSNLSNLISLLLSNGITREDIEKLNYLGWFNPIFSGEENPLYLSFEWDSLYKKLIFGTNKKEIREFSEQEKEDFRDKQIKNLNFKLDYLIGEN
ncbi:DNA polymerase III subunit alpha [Mycoplasma suis]|uniref:DNA polymerase III, alpha subunit n=1 Tax=Mycoplasma suis (strain Illinois) TaxID=768700 RepID=F0QQW4_MYCSL|nr:hypothetical protein [Mycoplasma suis]ADX97884.1 DNA polymerase III, alpha subunit [Mycoplasma suis str. Illinois]